MDTDIQLALKFAEWVKGQDANTLLIVLYIALRPVLTRWSANYQRRRSRAISRAIETQMRSLKSKGYEAMANQIKKRHSKDGGMIRYQLAEGFFSEPVGEYLPKFNKELKNIIFKFLEREVKDHIEEDKNRYLKKKWEPYAESTSEDLHTLVKTELGKVMGSSDYLDSAFSDELTLGEFTKSFKKIIEAVRAQHGRPV